MQWIIVIVIIMMTEIKLEFECQMKKTPFSIYNIIKEIVNV